MGEEKGGQHSLHCRILLVGGIGIGVMRGKMYGRGEGGSTQPPSQNSPVDNIN